MQNNHTLRVYDSILGLRSSEENPTPLIRLHRVVLLRQAQVFAKLEWYNPFGAVKDRIAINMIRDAEERGLLVPGKKLVEATSGNTGLGLAMVGNTRGYPLQTPLSLEIPLEKRTILRFFGADVVELDDSLCPAPGAPEGAIARAREAAEKEPDTILLDQYSNPANPEAHYLSTGPEIWRQTEGRVTHLVAGLGTCGTITGTGRFLKEKNSGIKLVGVYPEEGHSIPGVRSRRQLQQTRFYQPGVLDREIEISNREAFDLCLRLNREESVIAGPSSAMALAGALRSIPDTPETVAVVIFPDNIFKYASTVGRLFPQLFPAQEPEGEVAASKNDLYVDEMMENLKGPQGSLKAGDLNAMLDRGEKPIVIDVRPPERFAGFHIPGAVNIPEKELSTRTSALPADRGARIVMVCDVGKSSKRTTLFLRSLGYSEVKSLKGGITEWIEKGLATEAESSTAR